MPTILIIDDNRDLADSLGSILREEGYSVSHAANGGDGIRAAGKGHFDVILVDLKLPDMSGVQVFHSILKNDPKARLLMMTGHRIEQVFEKIIGDGKVVILQEPFDPEDLLGLLKQGPQGMIILVIVDAPECSKIMSGFLAEQGMSNVVAKNSRAAVDSVISQSPEVLLLDLHLPMIYGLEAYLDLKEQGHAVKTIIAMCKDKGVSGKVDVLNSAAMSGCLYKPFRPEKMLHSIEQVILR